MNLAEILAALPHLTHADRRVVCRHALLIKQTEEIAAAGQAAAEGFALLDRMETED